MNQDKVEKIEAKYKAGKQLAEKYEYSDVLLNTGISQRELMDEWARQVNLANKYRKMEADLTFILTWLQEYKDGLAKNAPGGRTGIKQINYYIENIKALLNVYFKINQIQSSIIKYYEKGGGMF